jgi:hypothetical protein
MIWVVFCFGNFDILINGQTYTPNNEKQLQTMKNSYSV